MTKKVRGLEGYTKKTKTMHFFWPDSNHPENNLEYSNYSRNVLEDVIDPTNDPKNVLEGFLWP